MANAAANGIRIEYETTGNPSDRPLLLISGLAGQLIGWDEELCKSLAEKGHYVIRFDNRDAGLSTHPDVPYTVEDMAADVVGLLDALGIPAAHLCGASMGGMIAQTLAIRYPARVLTLTAVYSTTGSRDIPPPSPDILELLLTPAPRDREGFIEYMVTLNRAMAGKGFPFDEAWTRWISGRAYDRSFSPDGTARQLRAVREQTDRTNALASVRAPTLVIQGTDDPLVPMEAAVHLSRAIKGARLMKIEGMGHDQPHGGAWPDIVEAVSKHTERAERAQE
ncbi:MAG: alpha/beta hydrolase [Deltaproteobacteria bacterium]|nr:alpha/beta hydrolase [Deltaproteobacteria bacterium]